MQVPFVVMAHVPRYCFTHNNQYRAIQLDIRQPSLFRIHTQDILNPLTTPYPKGTEVLFIRIMKERPSLQMGLERALDKKLAQQLLVTHPSTHRQIACEICGFNAPNHSSRTGSQVAFTGSNADLELFFDGLHSLCCVG